MWKQSKSHDLKGKGTDLKKFAFSRLIDKINVLSFWHVYWFLKASRLDVDAKVDDNVDVSEAVVYFLRRTFSNWIYLLTFLLSLFYEHH